MLETLMVIGVLGVLLLLTLPKLAPAVWQSQLQQSADDLAGFVHQTRMRAIQTGRCSRITLSVRGDDDHAPTLIAEELNAEDCLRDPLTAPHRDDSTRVGLVDLWREVARFELRAETFSLSLDENQVPAVTTHHAPSPATGQNELRFLPGGRLLSTSLPKTFGPALRHRRLLDQVAWVLVEPSGPSCVAFGERPDRCPG